MKQRAQIVKAYAGYYDLRWQNQTITCRARGNLSTKKESRYHKTEIYTGDWVEFSLTQDNQGAIEALEPRKNFLEDIRVANIDQVLLLLAVKNPDLSYRLLNEYLVLMRSVPDLPLLVVFNKIDLEVQLHLDLKQLQDDLKKLKIPSLALSAKTKKNLETLTPYLANKLTVLSGPSGAGKSTLINDFFPGWSFRIRNYIHVNCTF
jgi:ribosome biogenesis GTPase